MTLSPGCNGFPAAIKATVTYTLTGANALRINYSAVNTSSSLATVINLTNHTYFNLGGEGSGSVFAQQLAINANQYQPVDTNLIPTNFASVSGTAYDFRSMHKIGVNIRRADLPDGGTQAFPQLVIAHGYDNNWVLNGSGYRLASVAADRKTGIVLSTYTDQPGIQSTPGTSWSATWWARAATPTVKPTASRWRPSTTPTRRTTSAKPIGPRWS